jgi:hypothetical protein
MPRLDNVFLKLLVVLFCLISFAYSRPLPVSGMPSTESKPAKIASQKHGEGLVEFQTHPASAELLKTFPEVKGDIYISKCWTDKEGQSCLVIWGRGNKNESDQSELYAAKFHKEGSNYFKAWQIKEFTQGEMKWFYADTTSLRILDLNNDSIAETRFFYFVLVDGQDPSVQKYLLHVGNKKYAIRGLIPKVEPCLELYKKTPGSNFSELPLAMRSFADSEWDAYTKPSLEDCKGNGEMIVPESDPAPVPNHP